jgi:hypothetical protein
MIDWPEKFIYVCSAGEAAIVNTLPLAHAGPDRVVEAFVLCGVKDREKATSTERTHALEPTDRLVAMIKSWCPGRRVWPCWPELTEVLPGTHKQTK